MKLRASYTRKINHELYGGNSFENSDWHASLELDVDDETSPGEVFTDLQYSLKSAVDSAIEREIINFQGGLPVQDFKAWLYDYVADRKVPGEKYEQMSRYQQDLVQVIKRGKATRKRDDAKKT